MAEEINRIQNAPDTLTRCPICMETLKTPKCLTCLHTFCEDCLKSYLMKLQRVKRSFPCPVCREEIPAPGNSKLPRAQWAPLFKTNHLINSILDTKVRQEGKEPCEPCKQLGKVSPASQWCTTCREAMCLSCSSGHRGMKLTRQHTMFEIDSLKGKLAMEELFEEMCPVHKTQPLTFFCADHQKACCSTCAVYQHRSCKVMSELDRLGETMRKDGHVERLLSSLRQSLGKGQDMLETNVKLLENLNSSKQKVLDHMQGLRSSINLMLDKYETLVKEDLEKAYLVHQTLLERQINENREIVKRITERVDTLEATIKFASNSQVFLLAKMSENERKLLEDNVNRQQESSQFVSYQFVPDERIMTFLRELKEFGSIDVNGRKELTSSQIVEKGKFSVNIPSERSRCRLFGIDVQRNGNVVVIDSNNKKLKLFDGTGNFLSSLELVSSPGGLACLDSISIAVAMPRMCQVHIITYDGKELKLAQRIPTPVPCYRLCPSNGKCLVLHKMIQGNCLSYLLPNGRFEKCPFGKVGLEAPGNSNICYDSIWAKVYVTDKGETLLTMDENEKTITKSRLKGKNLEELTVDGHGNLFIVSYGNNKIIQWNGKGEIQREIQTLRFPAHIKLLSNGEMAVANSSGDVCLYTFG